MNNFSKIEKMFFPKKKFPNFLLQNISQMVLVHYSTGRLFPFATNPGSVLECALQIKLIIVQTLSKLLAIFCHPSTSLCICLFNPWDLINISSGIRQATVRSSRSILLSFKKICKAVGWGYKIPLLDHIYAWSSCLTSLWLLSADYEKTASIHDESVRLF